MPSKSERRRALLRELAELEDDERADIEDEAQDAAEEAADDETSKPKRKAAAKDAAEDVAAKHKLDSQATKAIVAETINELDSRGYFDSHAEDDTESEDDKDEDIAKDDESVEEEKPKRTRDEAPKPTHRWYR